MAGVPPFLPCAWVWMTRWASSAIVGVSKMPRSGIVDVERLAHARERADPEQRVPAEVEEAVVDADLLDAEQLGPDRGQLHLGGSGRRDVGVGGQRERSPRRGGQGAAVELAAGASVAARGV